MNHAITMGIFWHLIGAASAACFYAPFKKVKHWSWETMWSVGGIVSWLILPWAISATLLPDFWAYYRSFNASTLLPVFLFGAMWGIGNINYGLTMRYLGMSMGIGIAIGITLIVGTLMTPIINGQFGADAHPGRSNDAARRAGGGDWRRHRHPRRPAERAQNGHQSRRVQSEERASAGGDVRHLLGRDVVRDERRQTDA
jgi:hypothetical protein